MHVNSKELQQPRAIIKHYTEMVSGWIKYSRSGYSNNIVRDKFGPYLSDLTDSKKILAQHMIEKTLGLKESKDSSYWDQSDNIKQALKIMVEEETGCCFEQTLYVAFLLQSDPRFTKYFLTNIIMHSKENATQLGNKINHNYLLVVTESQFGNFPDTFCHSGKSLLGRTDMITADPWRNKVYESGISQFNHPLDYKPGFDIINTADGEFSSVKTEAVFPKTLSEFPDFHREIVKSKLLTISTNYAPLQNSIKQGNFALALRQSCAAPACIKVTELLLQNSYFLNFDIRATGASGKSAYSFACEYHNITAKALLQEYLQY